MLVLTRKREESVVVGTADNLREVLRVTVIEVRGGAVKLGFAADNDVAIYREEVWERVRTEKVTPESKKPAERPRQCVPFLD